MPMRNHSYLIAALLVPTLLTADAREDLERYQQLELRRLEEPATLSAPDRGWMSSFAAKYRKLFKKDPPGPSAAERAAAQARKQEALRRELEEHREAERKRRAAERAALGGVDPLPREVPIPPAPPSAAPQEPLAQLEARLAARAMEVLEDLRERKRPELWGPLLVDAVAYWNRKGAAAFSSPAYTALYLAQGYQSGYAGFPKSEVLAKSYRDLAKKLAKWTAADYRATHVMPGQTRPSGNRPPPLRIPISPTPPDQLLLWAKGKGMAGGPTQAQLEARQEGKDRERFYQILGQIKQGGGWTDKDKNWAREYERRTRGLPDGVNPPQFWAAWQEGLPTLNANQRAANEEVARRARQSAEREKVLARIRDLPPGQKLPLNTYLSIASTLKKVGTRSDWVAFAQRIPPRAGEPSVVDWFRSAGHSDLGRGLEVAYEQSFGGTASRPAGRSPPSGPSLYDQALQSQRRFEQYQRDSYMRGGNPNATPVWR